MQQIKFYKHLGCAEDGTEGSTVYRMCCPDDWCYEISIPKDGSDDNYQLYYYRGDSAILKRMDAYVYDPEYLIEECHEVEFRNAALEFKGIVENMRSVLAKI